MADDQLKAQLLQRASTGPQRLSDDEQKLRDLWNRPAPDSVIQLNGGADPVLVPQHAPPFRPDVPTTGGPVVANLLHKFLSIAPELSNKFSRVQVGPTKGALHILDNSKFGPEDYPKTNLLGVTSPLTGEISLNPRLAYPLMGQNGLGATLAHELTHASGHMGEKVPESAEASGANISRNLIDTLASRVK